MCCSGGAAHGHGRAGEALPHLPSFPIRRRALLLRRRFVRRDEDEDDKKITQRRLNVTKRTEIVMEWHGSNFRRLQWHPPDNVNSSGIFLICHIYSGMDPINLLEKVWYKVNSPKKKDGSFVESCIYMDIYVLD